MLKRLNFINNIKIILYLIEIFLFLIGVVLNNTFILFFSLFLVFGVSIVFSIKNIKKRIILFFFNLTFFVFSIGRIFIDFFKNQYVTSNFNNEVNNHILISLFLCLFILLISFDFFEKKFIPKENTVVKKYKYNDIIYKVFFAIFIISSISLAILKIEEFIYVYNNGYLNYYAHFTSQFPSLMKQIANFYLISFCSYISLFPKKKNLLFASLIFIVTSALTMLNGQRGTAIINCIILICYFFIRDYFNVDNRKIISKKILIILIAAIPLGMISLNYINYLRFDDTSNFNITGSVEKFIYESGVSTNVIGYEKVYEKSLDKHFYSFFPVKDLITNNSFTRNIFKDINYNSNTLEKATKTNDFSSQISYLVLGDRYLNGEGIGNCFIAETYKDFGYIGIVLISIIYAFFFTLLYKNFTSSAFKFTILLLMTRLLFYAPRSQTFEFLVQPFYSVNFIVIFFVFLVFGQKIKTTGKKQILFIIWSYSFGGGAEKMLTNIVNHINLNEYEIDILEYVNVGIKNELVNEKINILKPIIKLNEDNFFCRLKYKFYNFICLYCPSIIKIIYKRYKYDYEIAFNYQIPSFLLDFKTTTFCWNHGTIEDLINDNIRRRMQYRSFKKCSKIISISKKTYLSIISLFPDLKDKTILLHNGYDFEKIEHLSNCKTEYKLSKNTICFCGRLDDNKNPLSLLEVINKLNDMNIECHAIFIGTGKLESKLKNEIEFRNLQKQVTICGFQENPYPIIKQCKLMYLFSDAEGFPTVIVEGMFLNVPFISTDVGGIDELSDNGKCGLIVDSTNDAANRIAKLFLDQNLYLEMQKNGKNLVSKYSIDKQINSLMKLFEEMR